MSVETEKPPKESEWSWKIWFIWSAILFVIYAIIILLNSSNSIREEPPEKLLAYILSIPLAAAFYYWIYVIIRKSIFRIQRRLIKSEDLAEKAVSFQEDLDKDFFTNLVRINFKYLDKYYLQTQVQADKSFLMCLIAAVVGLSIIFAGIVMMLFDKTNPAYITTATVVISEFIAAVFFYLYNKTIVSMGDIIKNW